ncbi:hypothetical protein TRFO_12665 [Tritrichomonas foetus]|uniref:Uncharacterized protein n=1 Tax=Tritrichomonas foetus TaxID=1144522 RepID=A0A1J4L229_9EUKA|nr:hypothetical protein TRFO_12665 [Tritrichomonas foetus]|eukprot:OHT17136.1 hypothetical protein TRFO_12665 [Tritrichomonas foetus]
MKNAPIYICVFSSAYLILCIFMYYSYTNVWTGNNGVRNSKIYTLPELEWDDYRKNPEYHGKTDPETSNSLYVMILDSENKAQPFQCIMKKQWVDQLSQKRFVDGIEYYSRIHWTNPECNISTIVTPKSKYNAINPSSWILLNSFKMFLERSNAAWLFVINDAAYMDVGKFESFFDEYKKKKMPRNNIYITGSCIEQRYFFQMLLIDSGILMSRKAVQDFTASNVMNTWEVTCEVGINADETLAQVGDQIYIYVRNSAENRFVGREFRNLSDFSILEKREFQHLKKCEVPDVYINNPPGEQGICSSEITPFKNIIIWAAAGNKISKLDFLEKAPQMLKNVPDYLGYFWAQTRPQLCKLM